MGRVTRPQMEIVKFGTEDVIATSGIPFYPIFSKSINDLSTGERFLILNGEGLKSFSDWAGYHHDEYSADTLFLAFFSEGDWYNSTGNDNEIPGGANIADINISDHTNLTYIWYGSGYGVGSVYFNTQGQPWSYYLNNNISLPRSN